MVWGVLFGHGALLLDSQPGDYGEVRVYSGGSSTDEMSPGREESYRISRSFGAESRARVVAKVDYTGAGLLPNRVGLDFAEKCSGSFVVPEAERDVIPAPASDLMDAINFHAITVRAFIFCYVLTFF